MLQKIIVIISYTLFLNSILEITAKEYKGAEYRTKELFLYGRFEVSFMPAHREGVVSSFFTYRDPDSISADWNEIDIEFVGRYKNIIQFNSITPGQTFHIRSNFIDFNPYIEFHTYAFEWTPDYVAWFIDDHEVYRQSGEHIATIKHPQNIMMNIWNPIYTNWVGTWNENALPAFSYYDWVSYSSYTPGVGDSGSDNNFTFQWKDDFDFWDEKRWDLATHTFPGNQCDFLPGNIIFNEGKMILCLTNRTDTGYVDFVKPEVKWVRENFDNSLTVQFSEEVDEVTGETVENFLLSNVVITDAILSDDKMSVRLTTSKYDKDNNYNLIVRNIKDDGSNQNTIDLRGITVHKINELNFPIKINVGGDAFEDFLGDQEWGEDVEYGYLGGDVYYWSNIPDILNTEIDEVYRSERVGLTTYKIRVPNGHYKISIMFAKNDSEGIGDRVFDIVAENTILSNDLDIYAQSGKSKAHTIDAEINVTDEVIDLYFPEEIDSAFVNGIIIDQISTEVENKKNGFKSERFELYQNYPNPFNTITKISYHVYEKSSIRLKIYDVLGNNLETLVQEVKFPGTYNFDYNAAAHSSGIYFYNLTTDGKNTVTKKMVLLK